MVEEHRFDGHAVEGAEARSPVLALVPELATLGQPHAFGGERRVLEPGAERGEALERTRKLVADRLGLQVAVDPQDRFEALCR